MNEGSVRVLLDGNRRVYEPGDLLSGSYQITSPHGMQPTALELSVLWQTEGQGDEDLAVHYFQRLNAEDQPEFDLRRSQRFSVPLPHSPLSYHGVIVKIRWCVRVRAFLPRGKELVGEAPFQLGQLPAAHLAKRRSSQPETSVEADEGGGF